MIFVEPPPAELGPVLFSWTNNGPDGPKSEPLLSRLSWVGVGAMFGFVIGVVGFFVLAFVLEKRGTRLEGADFLYSLAGGTVLGALLGLPSALRKTQVLTLYVGKDACVQISGGQRDFLRFSEVESIRSRISETNTHGLKVVARELYVRRNGKESLWYVCSPTPRPGDPGNDFAEAVMQAFNARSHGRIS